MTALVNNRFDFDIKTPLKSARSSLATVANDIAQGFFVITHSSFALLGLAVVFAVITLAARPDLRNAGELKLMTWLQERRDVVIGSREPAPTASTVATASSVTNPPAALKPKVLSSQQAAVAAWISKKYSVAQEPVGALVAEAFEIGHKVKLDPTLILAIMAIESGFNPFAQSPVGAQGLMQVMTKIHHDKYANVGGKLAAFDPLTNLRVGVKVLQECISRAGSIEGGLKYYVGAANLPSDGGYAVKVMAEHARLKAVVGAKHAPASRLFASHTTSPSVPASLPTKTSSKASDEKVAEKVALLGES
ncbi:MAG: lytic transglycosylase domain-containing protein [Polaromonas sp.]